MIYHLIPLLSSFLTSSWLNYWFYPLFCLALIATVPCIIRSFVRR